MIRHFINITCIVSLLLLQSVATARVTTMSLSDLTGTTGLQPSSQTKLQTRLHATAEMTSIGGSQSTRCHSGVTAATEQHSEASKHSCCDGSLDCQTNCAAASACPCQSLRLGSVHMHNAVFDVFPTALHGPFPTRILRPPITVLI